MGDRYVCIEDFPVSNDYFGTRYGHGTIKAGDVYEVIREPIPEKKSYKMQKISKFNDEGFLYLRKSELNKYFKKVDQE